MSTLTEDDNLTQDDLIAVADMHKGIVESDRRRFDAVMVEIAKDERECRERLKKILIRKAAVQKAGHL